MTAFYLEDPKAAEIQGPHMSEFNEELSLLRIASHWPEVSQDPNDVETNVLTLDNVLKC